MYLKRRRTPRSKGTETILPYTTLFRSIPVSRQGLDQVVLRVRDVAAMQAFYCDVLGCTVEKRQEAIGLLQLRAGDSLIDLVDRSEEHTSELQSLMRISYAVFFFNK